MDLAVGVFADELTDLTEDAFDFEASDVFTDFFGVVGCFARALDVVATNPPLNVTLTTSDCEMQKLLRPLSSLAVLAINEDWEAQRQLTGSATSMAQFLITPALR